MVDGFASIRNMMEYSHQSYDGKVYRIRLWQKGISVTLLFTTTIWGENSVLWEVAISFDQTASVGLSKRYEDVNHQQYHLGTKENSEIKPEFVWIVRWYVKVEYNMYIYI